MSECGSLLLGWDLAAEPEPKALKAAAPFLKICLTVLLFELHRVKFVMCGLVLAGEYGLQTSVVACTCNRHVC